VAHLICFLPVV